MKVLRSVAAFREIRAELQDTLAFVPTMGALHDGHISLVRLACERADHVAVSIFVNPTQFDRADDLEAYPRTEEADLAACEAEGVDLAFVPTVDEMYPDGDERATTVAVKRLTQGLCGRTRPGHFDGVTTVVSKLFNIVKPDLAVFGEKDYQQLTVIRRMVRDLDFGIEIVGAPISRDPDGLAISSRNTRLSSADRSRALALPRGLKAARSAFERGEADARALETLVMQGVTDSSLSVDYIETVHPETLAPLDRVGPEGAVLAAAVFAGPVRLIDNVRLG